MRFIQVVVLLFVICFFGIVRGVDAQSPTETPTPTPESSSESDSKLSDLQSKIKEYEGKIVELQGQQKSLSSQIKIMDSQIRVTELKIAEVRQRIKIIGKDIAISKKKIASLQKDIDFLTKTLLGRIVAVYEYGSQNPWNVFLASDGISDFVSRIKYLQIVQIVDKKNVYAAEQAKVTYASEKELFERKQKEEEGLKQELDVYSEKLAQDRKDKETLLSATKNSEKEYQARLADAIRELQQIQKAAKILATATPIEVKRGDAIGYMGNTGYSFGAHLHFGVYNITSLDQYDYYSNNENPANVLESRTVNWTSDCSGDPKGQSSTGNGSFAWPMSTDNLRITQGFGHTCYSDVYYRGHPHPAFDMYNSSNIIVRAVEDGKAYFCRNCTGDGANGVFIFHPNGKMTLYWHLQ